MIIIIITIIIIIIIIIIIPIHFFSKCFTKKKRVRKKLLQDKNKNSF